MGILGQTSIKIKAAWAWALNAFFGTPAKQPVGNTPNPYTVAERLLQKSYFPSQRPNADEIPPVFASTTFTLDVARKIAPLLPKKNSGFDAVEYFLTRSDGQLRASHIPHPLAYACLVLSLEKNWANIPDIFNNKNSYIRPRFHKDGRLIVMKYDSWLTKTLKSLQWRGSARYIATADISNFFPSIYTHSIGWAVDSVKNAKNSKGTAWYDDLDRNLRLTKRNETNGVLIGPATSNIITEIILWKVDEKLRSRNFKFYRHVDDYKCYCDTLEEAESFIASISRFLGTYKLYLNTRKSGIASLPFANDEPWVIDLRSISNSLSQELSSSQVSFFIDQVVNISKRYENLNAYKYASSVLSSRTLNENSKITAFLALVGLSQFAPNLITTLYRFLPKKSSFAKHDLGSHLVKLLHESIRYNRSDAIVWLIYLIHESGGQLPDDAVDKLIATRECVACLMISAYGTKQQIGKVRKMALQALKSPDDYVRHTQWLLVYELYRTGIIKSCGADKPWFDIMKAEGVKFCSVLN
ncbi:MAG: antiviral reverse transcriptase Drt4 [Sphingopyxis sp.]|uniref:antiviral reverse transcriptase Drt4 n=1 Tax=Sphingopyxis sp. TaxID=1908224 RepID=UPI0032ED4D31